MSSSRHSVDSHLPPKMTTSPSKRQRTSPIKVPWKNPLDGDDSPARLPAKGLPPKPAGSLAASGSSRPAESTRRGQAMERAPSFGSSHEDYRPRDRPRYSLSPEKDPWRGEGRDYGGSKYDELDYRSQPSRSQRDRDWDRRDDDRGYDGRYEDRYDGRYEDGYRRDSDRREPRREERGYYADRGDRDSWRASDSRHGRTPTRDLGRTLTRPQRDDSSRNGRENHYRPDDSRGRYSPEYRSPVKRPRTPSGPPPDQHEEGELTEDEEEGQVKPAARDIRSPPPHSNPPNPYAPTRNDPPSPDRRRVFMRDRPSPRRNPPPPPARGRPNTPPPPPGGLPPPPPDDPKPPSPPGPASEDALNPYKPRNRPSHGTKLHEDPAHPPPAPNRNHLNPTTRASTPQPLPRTDSMPRGPVCPRKFARPSLQEEEEAYGKAFEGTSTLEAYDIGKKLGEGTFGVVTKGTAKVGGAQVALKKLLIHNPRDGVSVTTVREIKILKALKHKNVVPLVDMVVEPKASEKTNRQDIFMVFPFMDHDLCGLLGNKNFKLGHSRAKLFMKQLLEGMAYIHANGIVHRDIKTANILVNQKGEIMIADFGLARAWSDTLPPHLANEYTNMVVTRWYRAPELLLGDTHYGPAVDMWSVGCVLGEMYHKDPIMPGGPNDEDQMRLIAERLGPVNNVTLPQWDDLKRYPGFPGLENHSWDKEKLSTPLFALAREWGMDTGGIDLLKQLLRLDPAKRLSAEDALDHAWFWSGASIASVDKTDLGVESSHEMTTRKDHAPAPAYQQQLNDQNRQALQQHGSHRAYMPQQLPPMQGRPGMVGGPVRSHNHNVRVHPYPPPQMRNGYDAMSQVPQGGLVPMPGLPPGMPPQMPSQAPPYPFANGGQNGPMGGPMGMNGGGPHGPGNGWNGPGGGGGYGMGNGPPHWTGPPNGANGSYQNAPYHSQHGGNPPPTRQHPPAPMRAPPSGPAATSGRTVAPGFKLTGSAGPRTSGPAGLHGGGPPRDSRDIPPQDPYSHDDKRRRTQEHGLGDKRGLPPLADEREHKRPRGDGLPYG